MTKLHTLAAASMLALVGSAHALTPAAIDTARGDGSLKEVYLSGASALRLSLGAYIQEICNAGDFDVFFDSATGANHRAYSCTLKTSVGNWTAGTPVLVYKRDQGGSGQGVNPVAQQTPIAHMVVSAAACAATAAASPATDIQTPTFTCGTTASVVSDGGISDVEPVLLQNAVNLPTGTVPLTSAELGNLNVAPLAQGIFGVAVNKKLYRALQEAQGIIGAGGALVDVPANQNTWTAADIATIPSLPVEFVRAMLTSGNLAGGFPNGNGASAPLKGWNLVVPASVDANSKFKTLNVCRRGKGSGTQAASNAFFAQNPCNTGAAALTPLAANNVAVKVGSNASAAAGPSYSVTEASSTGNVETCIGTTVETAADFDGTGYGLGILGRENNPRANGGDKGYRYVKLDGAAPTRLAAKNGDYGFVYESTMQFNTLKNSATSDIGKFLIAIRSNAGKPSALAAADIDTQNGLMSPPATYTGPYVSQTGDVALFGSRVSRQTNLSCTPLRITK